MFLGMYQKWSWGMKEHQTGPLAGVCWTGTWRVGSVPLDGVSLNG